MSGKYAFALPNPSAAVAAALVEAVPDSWSWLTGQLDAPLDKISATGDNPAGLRITQYKVEPITLWDDVQSPWQEPTLGHRRRQWLELLAAWRPPSFIQFYRAGFDQSSGIMPLASVKSIVASFIRRGYVGDLFFHSDCYDNSEAKNPECCELHLAPYDEAFLRPGVEPVLISTNPWMFSSPRVKQPALVMLEWDKRYRGQQQNLQPLLNVCRAYDLQSLDINEVHTGWSFARPIH